MKIISKKLGLRLAALTAATVGLSGCVYDVKQKTGPKACPFNYLYWAFLIRQKDQLSGNPRLAMPYRMLAGWARERETAILAEADVFLDQLAENHLRSGDSR